MVVYGPIRGRLWPELGPFAIHNAYKRGRLRPFYAPPPAQKHLPVPPIWPLAVSLYFKHPTQKHTFPSPIQLYHSCQWALGGGSYFLPLVDARIHILKGRNDRHALARE